MAIQRIRVGSDEPVRFHEAPDGGGGGGGEEGGR